MRPIGPTGASGFRFAAVMLLTGASAWSARPAAAQTADAASLEFFEKKIRPVLTDHCLSCHSVDAKTKRKLKGGLYLDTREGILKGGDSGPSLVVGKPEESVLIKALRGIDLSAMPPKGPLPAAVIADFETWIRKGAVDPRTGGTKTIVKVDPIEQGRKFWAYQLPKKPEVPATGDPTAGEIDRFLSAALEAKNVKPAREADKATLIRRLYFDLVGLPPTPEQVDAFVNDAAGDAYAKMVDKLLASPEFGQRWGRHWLDVARYAESLTLRGFVLKDAWRYRDYVIDAYNADVPFDRFVREQIAGDLLPAADSAAKRRQMIAVTFLLLGNNNLEDQDKKNLDMDVVDEQLDTLGKAFLGQTISCARCHDHKFDPIPTADYYALAGILKNSRTLDHSNVSKWLDMPLPVEPGAAPDLERHELAVAALANRIKEERAKLVSASRTVVASNDTKVKPAKGVLKPTDIAGVVLDEGKADKVGMWTLSKYSGTFIGDGYLHDGNAGKGEKTLTFHPELPAAGRYELLFAYSAASNRATNVPVTVQSAEGEKTLTINQRTDPPLDGRYISLGQFRFDSKDQGFVIISNEGTNGHVTADAVIFLPLDRPADNVKSGDAGKSDAGSQPLAKAEPKTEVEKKAAKKEKKEKAPADSSAELKKLEAELKKLEETGPKRETTLGIREDSKITDARINVRGSVHNLGEVAPRGFLRVATYGPAPVMPKDRSGRKELADWLGSTNNPLAARVYVNRVWHWLFGSGLVRTVDNFGTTGELPSHPELLDHLAVRFVEQGWSTKTLIKAIVLSQAYRRSSEADATAVKADPENRLVSHANRRRLDAECIRDTLLQLGGKLKPDAGGPSFPRTLGSDYSFKYTDTRRSVYAPIFRNAVPEALEVFDFPDTSVVVGRRNSGTVAPQALFLMNHPFVSDQARGAAEKLLADAGSDDRTRIVRAYRLTLGRPPSDAEFEVARKFLPPAGAKPSEAVEAWGSLFHALFASVEFRYVQ